MTPADPPEPGPDALQAALDQRHLSEMALNEAQRLGQVGSWQWHIASDTLWSDQLYRILGLDPQLAPPGYEAQARFYTAESWQRLQQAVTHCLQSAEPYVLDMAYVRPDGDTGWLEARGEAVRANARAPITMLRGTVTEITARRELHRARFQRDAAEDASRNKTLFLSQMSHELRTPLNAVLGFAHLMRNDSDLSAKHQRWAQLIHQAGQHMQALVQDLLDLSGAELGRISVNNQPQDLTALMQTCLTHCTLAADSAGITLHDGLGDAPALQVLADGQRLRQVIANLLSNAIKYNRPGGRVTVTAAARPDGMVHLTVADTGVGLSAAQIARAGGLFDRLGAEQTAVQGTGVGLALSTRLLALMGGQLLIDSELDIGSRFTAVLPQAGFRPPPPAATAT
jgi:signal transduction histidine kinase